MNRESREIAQRALLSLYEQARFWHRNKAPVRARLESAVAWAVRQGFGVTPRGHTALRKALPDLGVDVDMSGGG